MPAAILARKQASENFLPAYGMHDASQADERAFTRNRYTAPQQLDDRQGQDSALTLSMMRPSIASKT